MEAYQGLLSWQGARAQSQFDEVALRGLEDASRSKHSNTVYSLFGATSLVGDQHGHDSSRDLTGAFTADESDSDMSVGMRGSMDGSSGSFSPGSFDDAF
jgi:hypothetical protein